MFRTKSTRRTKRAISPMRPATNEPVQEQPVQCIEQPQEPHPSNEKNTLEKNMTNFFEAESAAVSLQKPWLRLERGLRMQKYRAFAEAFPGLSTEEKDCLNKTLLKANDAKLLNTKQQIQYENGKIIAVKGLKVIRSGNPEAPAVFKIETVRPTKRNTDV
jgi:hypothetical protein